MTMIFLEAHLTSTLGGFKINYAQAYTITLIDYYFENDYEVFKKWENSQRTWKDSLEIFGSIQIEDQVFIDEDAIIVIN